MTVPRTPEEIDAVMRAAVAANTGELMTTIDTERALDRFRSSVRDRRRRRGGVLAAAASAVTLLAGAAGYAALVDDEPPARAISAARQLRPTEVTWSASVSGAVLPRDLAVLDGEVLSSDSRIVRLDARTGQVLGTVAVAGAVGAPFADTAAGTWVSFKDETRRGYARIDLASGRVEAVADVGQPYFIAAGGAGLWAVPEGEALVELDERTGAVKRTVPLPFRPFAVWVSDDAVWAQAAVGGALARIDAGTGEVEAGPILSRSAAGALAGGSLWVADPGTAELVRIDVDSRRELTRVALLGEPARAGSTLDVFVAAGPRDVYVTTVSGGERLLTRVDAETAEVVDVVVLGPGGQPTVVASDGGAVYVGSTSDSVVQRLTPPRR